MTNPQVIKNDDETTHPSILAHLHCANMIAVASGKGGVGKTWFSVTLCHTLAKKGKKVLLFDGDLGLANVDIQLGLTPERDLAHVIEGKMTLEEAITPYQDGGFDILAGRSGTGNLATLPVQKLSDLRASLINLAASYDYVIVDLGAGIDRAVRQMAGPAGLIYILLTDEPTSITDAYAFIKLSHAANPKSNLQIVVNMATNAAEGKKTYDTIRNACDGFLGFAPKLAGIVRRDARVKDSIRAQTPILTRSPLCEAAMDVEAITKSL